MSVERLTHVYQENGKTIQAIIDCEKSCKNDGLSSCYCKPMMKIRRRLAAYEDALTTTDGVMSPDELKAEIKWLCEKTTEINGYANQVALNYQHKCCDIAQLEKENAALKSENERLALCRHNCKIECLLEEYNKLQDERDTLKKALTEEKSRSYQAECNYDHTVKDRDELHEALKQAIKKLIFPYGCPDDDDSNRVIDNFMEQYIQQAKEAERK